MTLHVSEHFVDVVAKLELQAFMRDCQEIDLDSFNLDVDVSVADSALDKDRVLEIG